MIMQIEGAIRHKIVPQVSEKLEKTLKSLKNNPNNR
jgi:hypothetical protein